ncbi:hypothetical protein F5888DRAFT_1631851 [Russula emetica]|nr:hypothetical protein F5888DRAFT_1631851 [Russula emetica]
MSAAGTVLCIFPAPTSVKRANEISPLKRKQETKVFAAPELRCLKCAPSGDKMGKKRAPQGDRHHDDEASGLRLFSTYGQCTALPIPAKLHSSLHICTRRYGKTAGTGPRLTIVLACSKAGLTRLAPKQGKNGKVAWVPTARPYTALTQDRQWFKCNLGPGKYRWWRWLMLMPSLQQVINSAPTMDIDEPCICQRSLGHDVKEFKVFTWKLTGWKKLEEKLASPKFECGGHRWHILLFPFGNSNAPPNDTVSVYLNYADSKRAPEGWHACAQFALVISNPHDPTIYTVRHANHRFIAEECDWGFTRFGYQRKLFTIQDGHSRPTIEKEGAYVSVFVRVFEDPTGVLCYDSKKETGYVGLKNQGATSYMNTLLQSLFCTRCFRKLLQAVYEIPTEEESPTESVALALQRVFYHLQTSDQPVGTTELTKSFGWTSLDSFLAA